MKFWFRFARSTRTHTLTHITNIPSLIIIMYLNMLHQRSLWSSMGTLVVLLLISVCRNMSPTHAINAISMDFSSNITRKAVDISINFTLTAELQINQEIYIYLPYFTRRVTFGNLTGLDMDYGTVTIAPSTRFVAAWVEGSMNSQEFELNMTTYKGIPFAKSMLKLKMKSTAQVLDAHRNAHDGIPKDTTINLKIYKSNGIGAWCGFPSADTLNATDAADQAIELPWKFETAYNTSKLTKYYFESFPQMGRGCAADMDCNGHGACDFCREMCVCYPGYGSLDDIVTTGYMPPRDCSLSMFTGCKAKFWDVLTLVFA
jgi:hypothetical protein